MTGPRPLHLIFALIALCAIAALPAAASHFADREHPQEEHPASFCAQVTPARNTSGVQPNDANSSCRRSDNPEPQHGDADSDAPPTYTGMPSFELLHDVLRDFRGLRPPPLPDFAIDVFPRQQIDAHNRGLQTDGSATAYLLDPITRRYERRGPQRSGRWTREQYTQEEPTWRDAFRCLAVVVYIIVPAVMALVYMLVMASWAYTTLAPWIYSGGAAIGGWLYSIGISACIAYACLVITLAAFGCALHRQGVWRWPLRVATCTAFSFAAVNVVYPDYMARFVGSSWSSAFPFLPALPTEVLHIVTTALSICITAHSFDWLRQGEEGGLFIALATVYFGVVMSIVHACAYVYRTYNVELFVIDFVASAVVVTLCATAAVYAAGRRWSAFTCVIVLAVGLNYVAQPAEAMEVGAAVAAAAGGGPIVVGGGAHWYVGWAIIFSAATVAVTSTIYVAQLALAAAQQWLWNTYDATIGSVLRFIRIDTFLLPFGDAATRLANLWTPMSNSTTVTAATSSDAFGEPTCPFGGSSAQDERCTLAQNFGVKHENPFLAAFIHLAIGLGFIFLVCPVLWRTSRFFAQKLLRAAQLYIWPSDKPQETEELPQGWVPRLAMLSVALFFWLSSSVLPAKGTYAPRLYGLANNWFKTAWYACPPTLEKFAVDDALDDGVDKFRERIMNQLPTATDQLRRLEVSGKRSLAKIREAMTAKNQWDETRIFYAHRGESKEEVLPNHAIAIQKSGWDTKSKAGGVPYRVVCDGQVSSKSGVLTVPALALLSLSMRGYRDEDAPTVVYRSYEKWEEDDVTDRSTSPVAVRKQQQIMLLAHGGAAPAAASTTTTPTQDERLAAQLPQHKGKKKQEDKKVACSADTKLYGKNQCGLFALAAVGHGACLTTMLNEGFHGDFSAWYDADISQVAGLQRVLAAADHIGMDITAGHTMRDMWARLRDVLLVGNKTIGKLATFYDFRLSPLQAKSKKLHPVPVAIVRQIEQDGEYDHAIAFAHNQMRRAWYSFDDPDKTLKCEPAGDFFFYVEEFEPQRYNPVPVTDEVGSPEPRCPTVLAGASRTASSSSSASSSSTTTTSSAAPSDEGVVTQSPSPAAVVCSTCNKAKTDHDLHDPSHYYDIKCSTCENQFFGKCSPPTRVNRTTWKCETCEPGAAAREEAAAARHKAELKTKQQTDAQARAAAAAATASTTRTTASSSAKKEKKKEDKSATPSATASTTTTTSTPAAPVRARAAAGDAVDRSADPTRRVRMHEMENLDKVPCSKCAHRAESHAGGRNDCKRVTQCSTCNELFRSGCGPAASDANLYQRVQEKDKPLRKCGTGSWTCQACTPPAQTRAAERREQRQRQQKQEGRAQPAATSAAPKREQRAATASASSSSSSSSSSSARSSSASSSASSQPVVLPEPEVKIQRERLPMADHAAAFRSDPGVPPTGSQLPGGFLQHLEIGYHVSKDLLKGFTAATRDKHVRALRKFQYAVAKCKEWQTMSLGDVFPLHIDALNKARGWAASTRSREASSLIGAVQNLPSYTALKTEYDLTELSPVRLAMREYDREAKNNGPIGLPTATAADVAAAVRETDNKTVRAALMFAWVFAGRVGDVLAADKSSIREWTASTGVLHFRFSTGKKTKGGGDPYTLATCVPEEWRGEMDIFIKEARKAPRATLFDLVGERTIGARVTAALRGKTRTHLNARAIRRGALQALGDHAVDLEEIQQFAGHARKMTTLRYLNWGENARKVHDKMQGAARLALALDPQSRAVVSSSEEEEEEQQAQEQVVVVEEEVQQERPRGAGKL